MGGASNSRFGKTGALMYGFGQVAKSSKNRGNLVTMQATPNDSAETEPTEDAEAKTTEVVAVEDDAAAKIKAQFKPGYSFFVLAIVLLCRIMVQ